MFRKQPIIVVPGRTETQYVTRDVHEHRAPTDESVKLLKEFEDAADKRRVETLQLQNNDFHGKVMVEELPYAGEIRARCVFDLNGKRIAVDAQQDAWQEADPTSLLIALRDKMALRIAGEILSELASGMLTEWPGRNGSGRSLSSPVAATSGETPNLSPHHT